MNKTLENLQNLSVKSKFIPQNNHFLEKKNENSMKYDEKSIILIRKKKKKELKKSSQIHNHLLKKLERNKLLIRTDLIILKIPSITKYSIKNTQKIRKNVEKNICVSPSPIKKELYGNQFISSLRKIKRRSSTVESPKFTNLESAYFEFSPINNKLVIAI